MIDPQISEWRISPAQQADIGFIVVMVGDVPYMSRVQLLALTGLRNRDVAALVRRDLIDGEELVPLPSVGNLMANTVAASALRAVIDLQPEPPAECHQYMAVWWLLRLANALAGIHRELSRLIELRGSSIAPEGQHG